jgi:hypothetical protein
MATALDEALELVKRDPIAGFVAIPIIGARAPRPQVIVKLKGRSLILPDWTGAEWAWYGGLAFRFADSVDKAREGIRLVENANRKLTPLHLEMKSLALSKPTPAKAAAYYDATVRLVIAANVASDQSVSGPLFVTAFKESLREVPKTIGEALAAVLSAGGDVVKPIIRESIKIAADVFDHAIGTSIGLILIVGLGLWLWSKSKKGE